MVSPPPGTKAPCTTRSSKSSARSTAQIIQKLRDRAVVLTGFSWIVEPLGDDVVLAMEIPMGAAVAGPFHVSQARLEALIGNVLRLEREKASPTTIH